MAEIRLRFRVAKNAGLVAIVDDEDEALVSGHAWYAHRAPRSLTVYAKTVINGRWIFMHQLIVGVLNGYEIDHEDGDGLNNRRGNLRHLTHQGNIQAGIERRWQAVLDAREPELQAWLAEHLGP